MIRSRNEAAGRAQRRSLFDFGVDVVSCKRIELTSVVYRLFSLQSSGLDTTLEIETCLALVPFRFAAEEFEK